MQPWDPPNSLRSKPRTEYRWLTWLKNVMLTFRKFWKTSEELNYGGRFISSWQSLIRDRWLGCRWRYALACTSRLLTHDFFRLSPRSISQLHVLWDKVLSSPLCPLSSRELFSIEIYVLYSGDWFQTISFCHNHCAFFLIDSEKSKKNEIRVLEHISTGLQSSYWLLLISFVLGLRAVCHGLWISNLG